MYIADSELKNQNKHEEETGYSSAATPEREILVTNFNNMNAAVSGKFLVLCQLFVARSIIKNNNKVYSIL